MPDLREILTYMNTGKILVENMQLLDSLNILPILADKNNHRHEWHDKAS